MKIRYLYDAQEDTTSIVRVIAKHSDGYCTVQRIIRLITGQWVNASEPFSAHRKHLILPEGEKPNPPRLPYIDPMETMKRDAKPFSSYISGDRFGLQAIATLQT